MMNELKLYKNLNILVTGSTGFKGSWLCLWLLKLGAKVNGLALKPKDKNNLFDILNLEKKINQFYCNINDYNKTNKIIQKIKPDIIFHLAAQSLVTKSFEDPLNTIQTNVYGSAVILKTFIDNKCKALVFCTSDKCYKNKEWIWGYKENDELGGIDPYSSSKASAEIIFNSFIESYKINKKNTKCGSVRAGNVIGGGDFNDDRLIPDIIKNFYNNKSVNIKNPSSVRPWQFVLEPLFGYLKLGLVLYINKKSFDLASWNFGPDIERTYTVKYLIKQIQKKKLHKLKIKKINNKKVYESKLLFLSNEKAKLELNWKPKLDIYQTLDFTLEWYKNYYQGEDVYNYSINQIKKYSEM
jgi:CDP-glucose 4,6-dehydratase